MKTCTKCGIVKPLDKFHRDSTFKDGHRPRCAECVCTAKREKYAKDPEKAREKNRKWRAENLKKAREKDRRWYAKNAEKACGYSRKRYAENPEKYRKRAAAHRNTPHGRAYSLYKEALDRAIRKGMSFALSVEWVEERIIIDICPQTKLKFDLTGNGRTLFVPSIDRIDSTKGYTLENCQVVCWGYNALKQEQSHEDAIKIARALITVEDKS